MENPHEDFDFVNPPNANMNSKTSSVHESREQSHTRGDTPSLSQRDTRSHHRNGSSEHPPSANTHINNHYVPSNISNAAHNDRECGVCHKKFGVRRMRRKHTCRRCNHKVCGSCSNKRRYDAKTNDMVRVCDRCLLSEHCIVMTHRLRNLKLKHNRRNRGTYIVKVSERSKEYHQGLINKCKVIEINEQNVESLNAQLIADKLNTIRIPFSLTLDYKEAEVKHDQLLALQRRVSDNHLQSSSPNHTMNHNEDPSADRIQSDRDESITGKPGREYSPQIAVGHEMGNHHHQNLNINDPWNYAEGPLDYHDYPTPGIVTGPSIHPQDIYAHQLNNGQIGNSYV